MVEGLDELMKDLKLFNCKNMKKLSLFFMAAFMTDEATAIYSNRQEAALRLWELSKRCV